MLLITGAAIGKSSEATEGHEARFTTREFRPPSKRASPFSGAKGLTSGRVTHIQHEGSFSDRVCSFCPCRASCTYHCMCRAFRLSTSLWALHSKRPRRTHGRLWAATPNCTEERGFSPKKLSLSRTRVHQRLVDPTRTQWTDVSQLFSLRSTAELRNRGSRLHFPINVQRGSFGAPVGLPRRCG